MLEGPSLLMPFGIIVLASLQNCSLLTSSLTLLTATSHSAQYCTCPNPGVWSGGGGHSLENHLMTLGHCTLPHPEKSENWGFAGVPIMAKN